ncbi:hypothetical protein [Brevibacillus reuszeri]|uniref:hypothetical protein n=1 Tax=Brevibacillus reuszeri TaxID=54915 RepID=UPI00289726F2|nr:hypothetical protein [Brevibacillus reuszeri]
MNQVLAAVILFASLLSFSVSTGTSSSMAQSGTQVPAQANSSHLTSQTPTILAEAPLDSNMSGNTKAKYLVLVMTDGQYRIEEEPGPFTGPNWTGTFELQLLDEKRSPLSTLRLNDAFDELLFQKSFSFAFADYNHDGNIDFAIGQYASSNLYTYKLFTIRDGKIERLPIESDNEIVSSERSYSVLFAQVSPDSFKTVYYDNSLGKYLERVYQWKNTTFSLIREAETDSL